MKTPLLSLLILGAALTLAADLPDNPQPRRRAQPQEQANPGNFRPDGNGPGNRNGFKPPISPEEQKKLHEAFEKTKDNPAVKEAHEQAAEAMRVAQEAQRKAREISEAAAMQADPEVAPILEKIKKAAQNRPPMQPQFRNPEAENRQPRNPEGNNNNNNRRRPQPEGDKRPVGKPDGGEEPAPGR